MIDKPSGKAMNYGEWNAEKNDGIYFRKIIRYDVDSVLSYARDPDQFVEGLEAMGYEVDLSKTHWTLKHPQAKRPMRFYKLSKDGRYNKEHILNQLNTSLLNPMSPVSDFIISKEYIPEPNKPKAKGIKAMYIKYCFMLGIYRKPGSKQTYISPEIRKDLIYLEKITEQNTFVGKHNIETMDDVLVFQNNMNELVDTWMNQRRSIYNKIKRCRNSDLKQQLENDKDTLTTKIAHGKKELRICKDIIAKVPDIEEKIKQVNELENIREENQKEYERSLRL